MDPADSSKINLSFSPLEDFESIILCLILDAIYTTAAPGLDRCDGIAVFLGLI